jgi:hypothetical protein
MSQEQAKSVQTPLNPQGNPAKAVASKLGQQVDGKQQNQQIVDNEIAKKELLGIFSNVSVLT